MRRALIIVAALLLGIAVALTVYLLYNNHETVMTYDDFIYSEISLDREGRFEGRFQSVGKKLQICGYDFKIEGDTLYIRLMATSGNKKAFELDENGYASVEFQAESHIQKIVYHDGSEETELVFERN